MASNPELDPSTPAGVAALSETVSYYLNLRLSAKDQHVEVSVPPAVAQIVELAAGLPRPDVHAWAALAVGKMPKEAKAKAARADGGEGDGKVRSRGKWTEEHKAELVRMVDDEAFRTEALGADGTHAGHVNWSALARRYGFSGTAPIHRMYTTQTGRDPPGVKPKAPRPEGAEEPPAKKAKPAPPAPAAPKPPAAAKPGADGWTPDEVDHLKRLVEDEAYRKAQTGKRHLKWSRVGDVLKKGKKECKKKYTAVTGKTVDE